MKEVLDELKEENLYVDYEKDDDTTEDSAKEDTDLKKRKASTDLQDDEELEDRSCTAESSCAQPPPSP